MFAVSFMDDNREQIILAGIIGASTVLAVIVQWLIAERTRCPLCLCSVLSEKGCCKHREAKSFLGSYRLRVALAVVFKGSFRCPYCDEPSVLEVRTRRH